MPQCFSWGTSVFKHPFKLLLRVNLSKQCQVNFDLICLKSFKFDYKHFALILNNFISFHCFVAIHLTLCLITVKSKFPGCYTSNECHSSRGYWCYYPGAPSFIYINLFKDRTSVDLLHERAAPFLLHRYLELCILLYYFGDFWLISSKSIATWAAKSIKTGVI